MIVDPPCKRVWCLFKPWRLFPIDHLSRVEWQVLVPVFTSLITWLEASTFTDKNAWTPLTDKTCKCILREVNEHGKCAVNNRLYQHPKGGCTHQERY